LLRCNKIQKRQLTCVQVRIMWLGNTRPRNILITALSFVKSLKDLFSLY
jgi:hypothetical protein